MTLRVIELNDRALTVGDETGIALRSPGFALEEKGALLLGEEAERQARLKPTNTHNKYWQQLSLDPLSGDSRFRHAADIAHAHLNHLAEQSQDEAEVIFAVPASFSREQLSVLLGIAQHSRLTPVGLVDSALVACLESAAASTVIHADIQLHQVLLTRLRRTGNRLETDAVVQVPGVGSQNLMDLMMQIATEQFIQQSRFNPQHNADSEQQLYNALPGWLSQEAADANLRLELSSGGTNYSAKMPRAELIRSLSLPYENIARQIVALAESAETQLLLSPALAGLPGLLDAMPPSPGREVLDADSVLRNALQARKLIAGAAGGLRLVSALPLARGERPVRPAPAAPQPTHLLHGHRALPLRGLTISNGSALNGEPGADGLVLNIDGLPDRLAAFRQESDGVYVDSGSLEIYLNEQKQSGRLKLQLGDSIQFTAGGEPLDLIQVQHA